MESEYKEPESILNQNILVAYFYLSEYKPKEFFAKNKNFHIYNIIPYDGQRKKFGELKNEGLKLSNYKIIFIDGGNSFSNEGEGKELGDEIAEYIHNGGNFCTLGYTNVGDCKYSIKGRFYEEGLQVVQGSHSAEDAS
jgi:hypothetical protein